MSKDVGVICGPGTCAKDGDRGSCRKMRQSFPPSDDLFWKSSAGEDWIDMCA